MLLRRHAVDVRRLPALVSMNGGAAANMGGPAIDKGGPSNRTLNTNKYKINKRQHDFRRLRLPQELSKPRLSVHKHKCREQKAIFLAEYVSANPS